MNDWKFGVNIAGDVAGLRSATNTDRASWWASAGLERGQVKGVIKLAFNPVQAMRDQNFLRIYKWYIYDLIQGLGRK